MNRTAQKLLVIFVLYVSTATMTSAGDNNLEITYDDGSKQTFPMNQTKERVKSVEFKGKTLKNVQGNNDTKDLGFGRTEPMQTGFEGNIFFIPEGSYRMPNLDRLSSLGKVYTPKIDVPPRKFTEGFPGMPNRVEWFALRYTASFYVNTNGTYKFRTVSDDGAVLTVDNRMVIDDGGSHPPQSAEGIIQLSRGRHQIRLDYYQGPRYDLAIQLFVTPPGGSEKIFDLRDYQSQGAGKLDMGSPIELENYNLPGE